MVSDKTYWWQRGVIYQIYPRSFQDSNEDGIGDLAGITQRLDYIASLGVDAIWISPFYPSPMADFGYDISNFTDVDPIFGTLEDFDELLQQAHHLKLRVLIDFIPNHTSDQHPWFIESRSSRKNPRRDWYIWADPGEEGQPPNNWVSIFGGSAWEWDKSSKQYYLHSFLKEQPDLNWRNPQVQEAMFSAMRFWLVRGVDGFRLDAFNYVIKDDLLRDNPPAKEKELEGDFHNEPLAFNDFEHLYDKDQEGMFEIARMMRRLSDEYPERVLVGEAHHRNISFWARLYGDEPHSGLHLPFNFRLLLARWDAKSICKVVEAMESHLPEWAQPNYVLGNHDNQRIASRIGSEQARLAMLLLLTLRGTPTLYYGEEIGMQNVPIPLETQQDPWGRNVGFSSLGRDPERTPMQWDYSTFAGFSNINPWLPISSDSDKINVISQREDPRSMLTLTRRLLTLRRTHAILQSGDYNSVFCDNGVFVYRRSSKDGEECLVALNFTAREQNIFLPEAKNANIVLSTFLDRAGREGPGALVLRPNEGLLIFT